MKAPLLLAPVFVVALALSGCFLGSGGRDAGLLDADLREENQKQNTARTEVLTEYDAAGLADPDLARVYYDRGSVFAALGQTQRAIEHFGEAISLDPLFAEAYSTRGMANVELGQPHRAIQDFDRALQLSPGWPRPTWGGAGHLLPWTCPSVPFKSSMKPYS